MSATDCEITNNMKMTLPWNLRQIAEFYGVSRRTVQRWVRSGQLPPPIKIGQQRLWLPDLVMKFMEQRGREAQAALAAQNVNNFVTPVKRRRRNCHGA